MSLYKVKNLNTESETEVRIYRVSALGGIVSNEGFTNLDNLGAAIGVILKPGYNVSCEGALNRAGVIEIDGNQPITITVPDGPTIVATDTDDFITQMRNLGYVVDVMEEFVPPTPISCEGATGTVTFYDSGNWWNPTYPDRKCIVTFTVNDEQSITFDANSLYITDAIGENPAFQNYLDSIGLVVTLNSDTFKTTLTSSSDTPIRFKLEIDRAQSEIDPAITISEVYTNLVGDAVGYNDPNELFGCLIKSTPLISCVGATPSAYWAEGVTVNGDYTLQTTWTIDGVTSTVTNTGNGSGDNLGRLINQATLPFTGLYTNYDGFTRLELSPFGQSDYNPLLQTVRFSLATTGNITTSQNPADELSGAISLNPDGDELLICLKQESLPTINCLGESTFVGWDSEFNIFGNYELVFIETNDREGIRTSVVTGYSEFGKNLISIRNTNPDWPSTVECNGDGDTQIYTNPVSEGNGGTIRIRFTADQGFNFNATNQGGSTVNEYVDDQDRDVIEFCLLVVPQPPA